MSQRGRLTEWNDDRGFGFISPLDNPTRRIFVHVSALPRDKRRPMLNDLLTFSEDHDERGRPRASCVGFLTPTSPRTTSVRSGAQQPTSSWVLVVPAVFFATLVALAGLGRLPAALLGASVMSSVILFAMYGQDKNAAQSGQWRVSESSLHLVAFLGGWPGALVAQQVFRHKTCKQPFRFIFWCTVFGNCFALSLVAWSMTPG